MTLSSFWIKLNFLSWIILSLLNQKNWREEGKGLDHPFNGNNAQVKASERAINHWIQLDQDYKEEEKEMMEYEDDIENLSSGGDPLHQYDPIYFV